MFHYIQNLSPDDQHFDDFWHSQKSNVCLISDYDYGVEGDLFEAAEPIMEQPLVTLDQMTSVMSMILCGEDDLEFSPESKLTDAGSQDLLFEYKDMTSEVLNYQSPTTKEHVGKMAKSVSSDNLSSASVDGGSMNFHEMELKKVQGMRRVSSEGYLKPQVVGDHTTETRMQKLSRYRDKKTKRNFDRKIKYACRKALADGQPRIKGRFAKTEETNTLRKQSNVFN